MSTNFEFNKSYSTTRKVEISDEIVIPPCTNLNYDAWVLTAKVDLPYTATAYFKDGSK